jgi:hypothetical protein
MKRVLSECTRTRQLHVKYMYFPVKPQESISIAVLHKSIFRLLYMIERYSFYRNKEIEWLPKGARLSGSRSGDTCAIDEIRTKTHESRGREPTEAYKGKKTKGERRRKELVMKRCCQSRTTNLTLRVGDTECAKSNFALGERSGARRT